MNGFRRDAIANFADREYREAFVDEFLNVWIATQIRALREQRGWKQEELAREAGMRQSRISALEKIDYSSWSVNTLKRLAKAFGVTLVVEFRSYGERLKDFDRFEAREVSAVPFDDDPIFQASRVEDGIGEVTASASRVDDRDTQLDAAMVGLATETPLQRSADVINFSGHVSDYFAARKPLHRAQSPEDVLLVGAH